jgi:hypothetical protein
MAKKDSLRTVRFRTDEAKQVERYLEQNPLFEGFSALARVAIMSFIGSGGSFKLQPVSLESTNRPTFLWDYDLSAMQVREILSAPGLSPTKKWLMERILSQARFEDVCRYLTVTAIKQALPALRLKPKLKEHWNYAIKRWTS